MPSARMVVGVCVILLSGVLAYAFLPHFGIASLLYQGDDVDPQQPHLLFVGDVMLARDVERHIKAYGATYPYEGVRDTFESAEAVIGNFEAAVPRVHMPTPAGNLMFSVPQEFLDDAYKAGFDIFSLANNHSYDFGDEGFRYTLSACRDAQIWCAGHPERIDGSSLYTTELSGETIGIVFLNAVRIISDTSALNELFEDARMRSDVLIVYVHWGIEYERYHSDSQETLAHTLADFGADAVIGHHPHVVQDIELYNGVPIFYSLGNFIFDQYFSPDVTEGLMLGLALTDEHIIFTLFPVTSGATSAQPWLMKDKEYDRFLKDLNRRSITIDFSGNTIWLPRS